MNYLKNLGMEVLVKKDGDLSMELIMYSVCKNNSVQITMLIVLKKRPFA
jgi:hypothetical protein